MDGCWLIKATIYAPPVQIKHIHIRKAATVALTFADRAYQNSQQQLRTPFGQ